MAAHFSPDLELQFMQIYAIYAGDKIQNTKKKKWDLEEGQEKVQEEVHEEVHEELKSCRRRSMNRCMKRCMRS